MTKIESKKVQLNASCENVYQFLRDLNNLIEILPQSKISDWKSDENNCSFKVQSAYQIGMVYDSDVAPNLLKLRSGEGSPFPFMLNIKIEAQNENCVVSQLCEAQINPFLEMIVKGPLKNLFDYMADKLVVKFGGTAL